MPTEGKEKPCTNNFTQDSVKAYNRQDQLQDQLVVLLEQLKSLLEIGLSAEFTGHTAASWHSYLWVLVDLVEQIELAGGLGK